MEAFLEEVTASQLEGTLWATAGRLQQLGMPRRTEKAKRCIGFMKDWNGVWRTDRVLTGSFKQEIMAPKGDQVLWDARCFLHPASMCLLSLAA